MKATVRPPLWKVTVLAIAKREGRQILKPVQYEHEKEVLKRLAYWADQDELADLRIEKIGSIYELKDKWGPLGRINLRVYFGVRPSEQEVVVLKTYKKEEDSQAPRYVVITAEDRFEDYCNGGHVAGRTVYVPQVQSLGRES
jgi:hypothetical protein